MTLLSVTIDVFDTNLEISGEKQRVNQTFYRSMVYTFSRLFQTRDVQSEDDNDRDDINNIELDDVQKQLFNSPITDDEIIDNIKRLIVNKALAGNILPQHLIYMVYEYFCHLSKIYLTDCLPKVNFQTSGQTL